MDTDTAIDNFIDSLDLDAVRRLAFYFDIDADYPPTDDMYPDWENELRTELAEFLGMIIDK